MRQEIDVAPCRHEPGLWVALLSKHEGGGPRGEGKTKAAALTALAEELWTDHDDAFFDVLVELLRLDIANVEATEKMPRMYKQWMTLGLERAIGTVRGVV